MRSTLNALGVAGSLAMTCTAFGDFTGLGATLRPFTSSGGASYDTYELWATFDAPGDEARAVALGGTPLSHQVLDSGGGGFFQATVFGAHQDLPNNEGAASVPDIEGDSFVTIGVRQLYSGSPTLATIQFFNATDFNAGASTVVTMNGGWFVAPSQPETHAVPFPPPLPAGSTVFTPSGATHGVIVGQFTVAAGNTFSGDLGNISIFEDGVNRLVTGQDPAGLNSIFAFPAMNDGACCFDDGACSFGSHTDCGASGGTFQGGDVTCAEANCPEPGACCEDIGDCSFIPAIECEVLGGSFQGAGVTCSIADCLQLGACCFDDGSCLFGTQAECDAAGGNYEAGLTCATSSCPQPGACCFADMSCMIETEIDCNASGGRYLGEATRCAPNPCLPPIGACCIAADECLDLTLLECTNTGGTYLGDGTTCAPGACAASTGACLLMGGCVVVTETECEAAGGCYQGDLTVCPGPVPTVSEWGLIVLALLLVTAAAIFIRRLACVPVLATGGSNADAARGRASLFVPTLFGYVFAATFASAVVSLVGYHLAFGPCTGVDVWGTLICTPIVSYLIHLCIAPMDADAS